MSKNNYYICYVNIDQNNGVYFVIDFFIWQSLMLYKVNIF